MALCPDSSQRCGTWCRLSTTFFIDVLVMDEDTAVPHNRLALLQHIANLQRVL